VQNKTIKIITQSKSEKFFSWRLVAESRGLCLQRILHSRKMANDVKIVHSLYQCFIKIEFYKYFLFIMETNWIAPNRFRLLYPKYNRGVSKLRFPWSASIPFISMAVVRSAEVVEKDNVHSFCWHKHTYTGEWKDYTSRKTQFWMVLTLDAYENVSSNCNG